MSIYYFNIFFICLYYNLFFILLIQKPSPSHGFTPLRGDLVGSLPRRHRGHPDGCAQLRPADGADPGGGARQGHAGGVAAAPAGL